MFLYNKLVLIKYVSAKSFYWQLCRDIDALFKSIKLYLFGFKDVV